MLKSNPKTWTTLIIQGKDLDPDQISQRLGVPPDFFVKKELNNLHDTNSLPHWQLNSALPPDRDLEEHIYEILKKLAPKRREFREITEEFQATLYTSVEFAGMETNGVLLRPRLLLLLGDLGLQLEFLPWLDG